MTEDQELQRAIELSRMEELAKWGGLHEAIQQSTALQAALACTVDK
jgi:hypothetical protein